MANKTSIERTDFNWNFLRGCSRVSEGCRHCYAETIAARFSGAGQPYEGAAKFVDGKARWTGEVGFYEDVLLKPLRWTKPRRVFVNSMSDLFHEKVTDDMLDKAFAVMALTPHHTYQILTKRPERMREYFHDLETLHTPDGNMSIGPATALLTASAIGNFFPKDPVAAVNAMALQWPLPNVHLGVSVEDQKTADERIPLLLQTPAAVRWISAEPLIGPITFRYYEGRNHTFREWSSIATCGSVLPDDRHELEKLAEVTAEYGKNYIGLDWIVVGGESGPGARPFDIQWARDIIAQCKAADVPVFVKQLGAYAVAERDREGRPLAGLFLKSKKGGDMSEWPEDLRVREFPRV